MTFHYDIADIRPYINWVYFYHAWQLKDGGEQQRIRQEAETFLDRLAARYHTHALLIMSDACSDGDDIVLAGGERIPCLRQQQRGSDHLCLADFIIPKDQGQTTDQKPPKKLLTSHLSPLTSKDLSPQKKLLTSHFSPLTSKDLSLLTSHFSLLNHICLFATTVDAALETDFDGDPYQKMMAQLLADRLAEATAERLHEQVRKDIWGYAKDEHLSIAEMQQEHFLGIRPAVGYPSLPDTSVNFVLDRLLGFKQIGISLTEHGAMRPHASVSGLMMAHPEARYFSVGKIGDDQLHDYARRRSLPVEVVRKFLSANL